MIDNEKGNCWQAAKDGLINVQNVWLADCDIVGSDMNKQYKDSLALDYKAKTFDPAAAHSFSTTWFLAQKGNQTKDLSALLMSSTAYIPQSSSPVLTAADFTSAALKDMEKVSFLGACDADAAWLSGWTNFDPQNTDY